MMYYYYPPFYPQRMSYQYQKQIPTPKCEKYNIDKKNTNIAKSKVLDTKTSKENQKNDISFSDNTVLFEILGIKLYFDDLLIICLIFFLYTEGVQDQILFVALILLLLG